MSVKEEKVPMNIPQHVAIILDGNGRWAKSKGMPRNYGHAQGSKNVERICEEAWRMGIKYLTVYAFSTENWNRPKEEVDALMKLLRNYMKTCLKTAAKNDMKVRVIGDLSGLDEEVIHFSRGVKDGEYKRYRYGTLREKGVYVDGKRHGLFVEYQQDGKTPLREAPMQHGQIEGTVRTYFANGILFNRIPWIKMLRIREVLSFKGFFGNLSDKNNPLLTEQNPNLWRFPGENAVYVMDPRRPYMEFGAGLDNIFKILRIEYVWRLTYREHQNVAKGGVRIALHFSF